VSARFRSRLRNVAIAPATSIFSAASTVSTYRLMFRVESLFSISPKLTTCANLGTSLKARNAEAISAALRHV
jgi:hypothetical protein